MVRDLPSDSRHFTCLFFLNYNYNFRCNFGSPMANVPQVCLNCLSRSREFLRFIYHCVIVHRSISTDSFGNLAEST